MNKLKKETIEKLEELKKKLSYDMKENYCNLMDILVNYDNEAQDDLYLYDTIQENYDFIDNESLEDYVKSQFIDGGMDVDRLRCFLDGTYSADIYYLDGYGNLCNVDSNYLEMAIDGAIEMLESEV